MQCSRSLKKDSQYKLVPYLTYDVNWQDYKELLYFHFYKKKSKIIESNIKISKMIKEFLLFHTGISFILCLLINKRKVSQYGVK